MPYAVLGSHDDREQRTRVLANPRHDTGNVGDDRGLAVEVLSSDANARGPALNRAPMTRNALGIGFTKVIVGGA